MQLLLMSIHDCMIAGYMEWQWKGVYQVNEWHSMASRINTPPFATPVAPSIWRLKIIPNSSNFVPYLPSLMAPSAPSMVFWQIAPDMSIGSGKISQWVKSVGNCMASLYKTAPTTQIPPPFLLDTIPEILVAGSSCILTWVLVKP